MDRPSSPASNSPSVATSPPSSPAPSDPDLELQQQQQQQQQQQRQKKKVPRKKRKQAAAGIDDEPQPPQQAQGEPSRKKKPKTKRGSKEGTSKAERSGSGGTTTAAAAESSSGTAAAAAVVGKKARKQSATKRGGHATTTAASTAAVDRSEASSPAQSIVHDQMRKALEEDQYSAIGSIVNTDSDSDDHEFMIKGRPVRLDRNAIMSAMRKRLWMERVAAAGSGTNSVNTSSTAMGNNNSNNHHSNMDDDDMDDDTDHRRGSGGGGRKKKKKKGKRKDDGSSTGMGAAGSEDDPRSVGGDNWSSGGPDAMDLDDPTLDELERDEGSIFGQTTGNSNSIWVECDKCKKWRRLRGVVDEKKLPSKWYCSMNKNDPERARCTAPEEEYDTTTTPESAADARTRKHLRVWVRRLQCNEAYESRQPTLTRGKKRAAATNSKEPYEWIRCCNPSCGKWRAILRIMDAKNNVMDRTTDGEWYCVMNTWDEKTASCAAPQENLPAVGCPPWVMQDE